MIEALISALIYICLLVLAMYLLLWVLAQIGISIPQQVERILWVVVLLVALLIIVRTVLPRLGIKLVLLQGWLA